MSRFLYVVLALTAVGVLLAWWTNRSRRPRESGFRFVYVNQDGSARELTADEKEYLQTDFHGADGARPYVKSKYESKDGWGSISGFIERRKVPARIAIAGFDLLPWLDEPGSMEDVIADAVAVGDTVDRRSDGSVSIMPNPALKGHEGFRLHANRRLSSQKNWEDEVMRLTNSSHAGPHDSRTSKGLSEDTLAP